jgi:hypothetical protein
MKASELRLGNLILFRDNLICLDSNYELFKSLVDISRNDKRYKPIPLSEEWLLKFGFETNDVRYWQISSFRLHINRYGEWIFKVVTFEQEIKYVHSLQNLYFSLTGEELTLKNKEK